MIVGISTMLFNERLLNQKDIIKVKENGINYLELSDSHKVDSKILDILNSNNIDVFSIHAEYLNSDISDINEDKRLNGIIDIRERINALKKLNGKVVVVHPGGWYKDKQEREPRLNNCINSLVEVVKYADLRDIKIAIENLPPDFFGDNLEDLSYILNETRKISGSNNSVGICLDTGHAFLTNNLYEAIDFFKEDILTMHIQDNFGDNNNDRSLAVDDIHCPPGHGNINWEYFFSKLNEYDYKGGLIFEVKVTSIDGKDEMFMLKEIRKFIIERKIGFI